MKLGVCERGCGELVLNKRWLEGLRELVPAMGETEVPQAEGEEVAGSLAETAGGWPSS